MQLNIAGVVFLLCLLHSSIASTDQLQLSQAGFAAKLLKEACGNDNCIFSPYSIYNALGMVLKAAGGNTESQIMDALQFTGSFSNNEQLHSTIGEVKQQLIQGAMNSEGIAINLADNIFISDTLPVSEQYINDLKTYYSIDGPKTQNFAASQEAADAINMYVEQNTKGQITELVQPTMFDESTLAVLLNAIFFNASWQIPFYPSSTQQADFYVDSMTTVQVPMMTQTSFHRFSKGADSNVIELPYEGGDFVMYVIVPQGDLFSFRDILMSDPGYVQQQDTQLQQGHVEVYLPKFSLELMINLKEMLEQKFGVSDLFTPGTADLLKMVPEYAAYLRPYVSQALHKATIDVSEKGTVASAATVITAQAMSAIISQPSVFEVNKPFIYMIVYKPTNSILFMGQVIDPTK